MRLRRRSEKKLTVWYALDRKLLTLQIELYPKRSRPVAWTMGVADGIRRS